MVDQTNSTTEYNQDSETKSNSAKISRRHMLGGAGAGLAVASTSLPTASASVENLELVLVRKPALSADGRVVAPCVRSRLFVRRKGSAGYGRAVCDFIETPKIGGQPFRSDIPVGANATGTRFSTVRGYLGLNDESWELVIGDQGHAGAAPSTAGRSKLAASLPINTSNAVERENYTKQVEPKRAIKQLKKLVSRFGDSASISVVEDAGLFADIEIDIPGVGNRFSA